MIRFQLAVIFLAAPLWAQQTMSLTLAEAERLAIRNNPQFSAARFNAAAAYPGFSSRAGPWGMRF